MEQKEEPAVGPDDVEKMIREMDQTLAKIDIQPGTLPDSDAKTFSPYCTLRSDRWKSMLLRQSFDYMPSWNTGTNFNPCNHPNPFATLLNIPSSAFDPADHFLSCCEFTDAGATAIDVHFHYTLSSFVREYALFDSMDEAAQEQFVFESCLERGGNINAQFLKVPFRENDAILLAVKCAFFLVLVFEADLSQTKTSFHYCVNHLKFSTHYPYPDSFKAVLNWLEIYSARMNDINLSNKKEAHSLDEMLQVACEKRMRKLPNVRLIELLNTGHLYTRQAALDELRRSRFNEQKFTDLLQNLSQVKQETSILM